MKRLLIEKHYKQREAANAAAENQEANPMEGKKPSISLFTNHLAGSGPGQADPEKIRIAIAAAREQKDARLAGKKRRKRSGATK
jgi:hypothetical protein